MWANECISISICLTTPRKTAPYDPVVATHTVTTQSSITHNIKFESGSCGGVTVYFYPDQPRDNLARRLNSIFGTRPYLAVWSG